MLVMAWMQPDWDEEGDFPVARLCGNPDSDEADEDWPRIAILHLSAEEFVLFTANPIRYLRDHHVFPEQPVEWISDCMRPPLGKGIPQAAPGTGWTVVVNHGKPSIASSSAIPDQVA